MPCYSPLYGYRGSRLTVNGKREIIFRHKVDGFQERASRHVDYVTLPCGGCIGCRLDRSRDWAIRCFHESSLYTRNCFLTLTYSDVNLPVSGSVSVREIQLFMKRLRKRFGDGIRFFHCGEYGSRLRRPHYHVLVFNFDFEDRVLWSERNGTRLFVSKTLEDLWGKGFCTIGDVTFESAGYVARYILKKVTGDSSPMYYGGLNPEYVTMSRRPGIGYGWYKKYKNDVYPEGSVVVNGVKYVAPSYYDKLYAIDDPAGWERLKLKREADSVNYVDDVVNGQRLLVDNSSPRRLNVRETVKMSKICKLSRSLEEANAN